MPLHRLDVSDDGWVDDPRLAAFRAVRDPELVRQQARFLAEGRIVVRTLLLDSPLEAEAVLLEEPALTWFEAERVAWPDALDVFVVPSGAMAQLGGFRFHQGCLAAGVRPAPQRADAWFEALDPTHHVVVGLDGVSNPDNVGAIFRTAAALGAGGILLGPTCASPLYRKAIRSSMGAALRLPFCQVEDWQTGLDAFAAAGYERLALTPDAAAEDLEALVVPWTREHRRALLLGAEGPGLGHDSLTQAEHRVRIPMDGGVDSLNVAAAAAVALYALRG